MNRIKTVKRVLAVVLSLSLLMGTWAMPGMMKANASTENKTTGALSVLNEDWQFKTGTIVLETSNLGLNNTSAISLTPVSGKAGMLHNGVAFSGTLMIARYADSQAARGDGINWIYWNVPDLVSQMNVQVGDELKVFGEFTYDDGASSIWVTPTVIRCVELGKNGVGADGAKVKLISSAEETPKTVEKNDNLISISDFSGTNGLVDASKAAILWYGLNANVGSTVLGKSFKTNITYNSGGGSARSNLYYGATYVSYTYPENKNCVHIYTNSLGMMAFTIYSGTNSVAFAATAQNALSDGEDYVLEIDISEQDASDNSTIVIKLDGEVMINESVNTAGYGNCIATVEDGAAAWTAEYHDSKADDVQEQLELIMDEAPEITALDFGLEEGTYTTVPLAKKYGKSIDGKKLVLEISDIDCKDRDTDVVALDYAGWSLYMSEHATPGMSVLPTCRAVFLKSLSTTSPYKIEIYTEYMDLDGDGLNDDIRSLLRVNGTLIDLALSGTCNCSSTVDSTYWLCSNDKLYSETTGLKFYQPMERGVNAYKISSVNTHAKAVLEDGVLTISGTGTVFPFVLRGVVTDAAIAATVKKIIIEDGLTAVASNVFNGYTNLETVIYGDSLETVSDTAFVKCNTGVEVTCPIGKVFGGGLGDAVFTKRVIDIYLVAGQSNAAGWTKYDANGASQMITQNAKYQDGFPHIYYGGTGNENPGVSMQKVTMGLGAFSGSSIGPELGMAEALSEYYNEDTGKYAGIIKYAQGGTALVYDQVSSGGKTWASPSYIATRDESANTENTGVLYQNFLAEVEREIQAYRNVGVTPVIKGLYWMQGESDLGREEEYAQAFQYFASDVRSDLSKIDGLEEQKLEQMPIMVGLISETYGAYTMKATNRSFINMQKTFPTTIEYCFIVDNSQFAINDENGAVGSDRSHWNWQDMLTIGQNVGYTMASVYTNASAVLENGVLTISGKGTVLPSVLTGVVTGATAGTVTDIVIGDGITAVASKVFNGLTNLERVTYASSVETVWNNAFVNCNTGVEVTCPSGKEFLGGLKDAFIVKAVANIAVPETGIVNPAVIVTRVDSKEIYNALSGSAVAILNIDSDLNILDAEGQKIATVEGYMKEYKNKVVPAFYMDDAAEATAIATYLQGMNNRDAFYMAKSEDAALIKTAKETFKYIRGIIEYDELPTSFQERGRDRRDINNSLAMVAVYPSQGLTADIVAEYNLRGISVWSYAEENKDVYTGISNGVNGLVTSDPSMVVDVYESITDKTLSGKPQAIAHRGYNNHPNSKYPENTLETYKDSVKKGSAALEMDIQLTKDKQLIVKSDCNLTVGTNGTGVVSAYTLQQLKKLYITRGGETTSYRIPSLREVFDEFKDTDVALYLHVNYIKDPQGEAAEGYIANYEVEQINALQSLVKEFEQAGHSIADNVVVFFRGMTDTLAASYRGKYGISLMGGSFYGTASGYYASVSGDPYAFISILNSELGASNSQQLPINYDAVGTGDALAYRMAARGYLTLQTVYDAETQEYLDDHFINDLGSTAIITNHSEYLNDYAYQVDAKDTIWVEGETINLQQKVTQVVGENTVSCGLIDVSTGETLATSGSSYVATKNVEVVYYADIALERSSYGEELTYRIYSAPVTITVVDESRLGDLDLDTRYTVIDLVKMIKTISEPTFGLSMGIYDVNRDSYVDALDVVFMREVLAGKSRMDYGPQIELTAFMGPPSQQRTYDSVSGAHPDDNITESEYYLTEQDFQDYKDAGFTYLLSESSVSYTSMYGFEGSPMQTYMELAEKVRIPVVAYPVELAQKSVSGITQLEESDKQYIDQMLSDLSQYKMFKGIMLRDEPSYYAADGFKAILDYVREKSPNLYNFNNMLPIHAGQTAFSADQTLSKEEAYKQYIRAIADATGTFAYDYYPLRSQVIGGATVTSVRDTYYQNYELVAQDAKEHDYDMGMVVQSSSWGVYEKENSLHCRKTNTKADIGFQVYSALAYGAKYIGYYTYWEHKGQSSTGHYVFDAMVMYPDNPGEAPLKTDTYYAVQAINQELKKFDQVFLQYDWEGCMAVTAPNKEKSTLLSYVGECDSSRINGVTATDETLIGCMKNEDGNDGFFIVNATDPGKNLSNDVTVTFNDATSAVCYIKGEETVVELTNGSYTFELEAGEGVFVIPVL